MHELTRQQQEQVERLFAGALEAPPDQRAALLASTCSDPAVQAEVQSLLAARPAADRVMHEPIADARVVADALRQLPPLPEGQESLDEAPDQIGPYAILSKLGTGGMGSVYLAQQSQPLRRQVALKLLKLGMDTRSVIARFEAERQALALMEHPNIARALDAGATAAGRPYFVMEYVAGERVTDYCDQQRLDTAARLRLFAAICAAIQHAHQKGIIHRDIKPSNVLVADQNGAHAPKVIDFGVTKALHQRLSEQSLHTEQGVLIGTPEYMSPEQADPGAVDIDTRTDIYALGVLLYELLVGALPLDSSSVRQVGFGELQRMIREDELPKPSTRLSSLGAAADDAAAKRRTDTTSLRRQLRGDLDWVVMKCLEKDRERRYATAAELAADIGRYLEHKPVAAGPPGTAYRVRKFVRRNRALVGGAAVALIAVIAGTISTGVFAFRESRQRAVAETQARIAEAVNDFLNAMLASVDPREQGPDVSVRQVLDEAAERVETELAEHPAVEREVQRTIGQSYIALGLFDEALPHHERALALAVELHGERSAESTVAMNELGYALKLVGRFADAESLHRRALKIETELFGENDTRVAASMNSLANTLYDQGKYDEGRPLFERAFEIRSELLGERNMDFVTSLNNLSRAHYSDGDYAEAEAALRECLRLLRDLFGDEHVDTIRVMGNVAFMAMQNGKYAEAEPMFREVLELYRKQHGASHPDIARALNSLGSCLFRQGRPEDAAPILRESLDMRRETLGDEHPLVATSLNNLALTLTNLKRYDEALALHRESLAIRRAKLGEQHPDTLSNLNNLAYLLNKQGAHDEARELFEQVLAIRLAAFGEEHPKVANTQMNLARCLRELDQLEQAEALCRSALRTQLAKLGADHPHLGATYKVLGQVLTQAGRYVDAESAFLKAVETLQSHFGDTSSHVRGVYEELVELYEAWGRPQQVKVWREKLQPSEMASP